MTDAREESIKKTKEHINRVRHFISIMREELLQRGKNHDKSKLSPEELDIFAAYTPKLKDSTYGSEEYKKFLKEMKPALDHHYADINNRHHPEHFANGILGMNLIDIIELICDWRAATERHKTGDIRKSITINQERFGYSDELKQILLNTVELFEK